MVEKAAGLAVFHSANFERAAHSLASSKGTKKFFGNVSQSVTDKIQMKD
jgi:hypothetical protein